MIIKTKNVWDAAKTMITEKFSSLNVYIRKEDCNSTIQVFT